MKCRYLYRHTPANSKWSVASCSARNTPYVPSMSELESFCAGSRHARCPAYLCAGSPFRILVRNTDDHPRNHGFLMENGRMTMSPAYDIVPSLARPGVGTDFRLAMAVGEHGREATLVNALSRAARFGFMKKEAQETIDRVIGSMRAWRDVFHGCGVPVREMELLAPSFRIEEGW